MSVLKINKENFEEEVLKANKTVLIDFYADWCGPCQRVEINNEIWLKINVDENQELAMEYNVMTIPTILLIKEGEVKKTFIGVTDKSEILEAISQII